MIDEREHRRSPQWKKTRRKQRKIMMVAVAIATADSFFLQFFFSAIFGRLIN